MTLPAPLAIALDRPREAAALFLAIASLVVVGSAWGFEFAGFVPCKLCLMQREPYYAAVPVALLAFAAERWGGRPWPARLLLLVIVGLFVWGGSVGAYQAGAEWGWWPGPTDCGATRGATIPTAAGDLLGSLNKVKIVDCTKAQLRILGLSFAGWNVIVSAGLVILTLAAVLRPSRPTAA